MFFGRFCLDVSLKFWIAMYAVDSGAAFSVRLFGGIFDMCFGTGRVA
jgi:hypothetical protein